MQQLRYGYRLYPSPGQCAALARAFGCARVVFNDALLARQQAHAAGLPYITDETLSARRTRAKASVERAWLSEVSAVVLQQALADLNAAYRNFFASLNGQRQGAENRGRRDSGRARITGRQSGSPRTPASRCCPAGGCACPRSGMCKVRWSRPLSSRSVQRDRDQGRGRADTSPAS